MLNRRYFIQSCVPAAMLASRPMVKGHADERGLISVRKQLPILVFDVNETLLDLTPFVPVFTRMFGNAEALREYFAQVVIYSSAVTLANAYVDSGVVSAAVLAMMAQTRHRVLSPEDLAEFKQMASSQPIYPDVLPALTVLRDAGFRMVTLSNNPTQSTDHALKQNGILNLFERTFSVDDHVHRFKPAPESYHAVAGALSVQPETLCLISCHAFDVLGAAAAGLKTLMLLRPENAPIALGKSPDIVSHDLHDAVGALIAKYVPNEKKRAS